MTTIFSLSLTASLMLALLFPVFNLLVSRCRTFRFNRFSMLAGIVVAILAAALLPYLTSYSEMPSMCSIKEIPTPEIFVDDSGVSVAEDDDDSRNNLIALAVCIYWLGVMAMLMREAMAYIRLMLIISKSEKTMIHGYAVRSHRDKSLAPFSWGNCIVVGHDDIAPSILIHEKAHTEKHHWIDVMIADVLCIMLWYNPFAWMLRRLIKLNHEFEADAEVIEKNPDILGYQRLLITQATGHRTLLMANNFSISKGEFRKRVLAMSRPHTSGRNRWSIVLMIPALAIALYAGTSPLSARIRNSISDFDFNFLPTDVPIGMVEDDNAPIQPYEGEMRETSATVITKRIPSPITDPEPFLHQFELSIESVDKDLLPDEILARIVADEDGNIVSATTNHDDNPEVRVMVDKATNAIQFEVVREKGKNISTRFALPIRKTSLPY